MINICCVNTLSDQPKTAVMRDHTDVCFSLNRMVSTALCKTAEQKCEGKCTATSGSFAEVESRPTLTVFQAKKTETHKQHSWTTTVTATTTMSGRKKMKPMNSGRKDDVVKEREHENVMKEFIKLNEASLEKDEMTITGNTIMNAVNNEAMTLHTGTKNINSLENEKLLAEIKKPMFWLRGNSTKALCDELAHTEGNGWGKMRCCSMIASLIVDTISLCNSSGSDFKCVDTLRNSSNQDELTARNKAPREVAIFIEELDCERIGLGFTSTASLYPKEKHEIFMEALEQVDVPFKNFGTFKSRLTHKYVIRYLKIHHNILTWQFGKIMAPSDWSIKKFGEHLLREY